MEADALVANEIPATARASRGRILEHQVVADKVASAGQAPIASLAPGVGDEVNRSTVNPLAGDIDASATGDRIAARALDPSMASRLYAHKRRAAAAGSTIDTFTLGHVAQRQAPAEAMVPFTATGGADAPAASPRVSKNPSSGGPREGAIVEYLSLRTLEPPVQTEQLGGLLPSASLGNATRLPAASTGVRHPAEIAEAVDRLGAASQAHQSPSSENPLPFSGNMRAASVAGITAVVQPDEVAPPLCGVHRSSSGA